MKRLQDKVILITGASSGIGRACAERSRAEGARVFGLARRGDRLAETCDAWATCDVTDADGVHAAISKCADELGGIDALVNAAGIFLPGGFAEDGAPGESQEIWDRQMRVNVDGVRHATLAATPHLIERKGSVVNVSSVCGTNAYAGILAYCVSKAAVDMMTRCAALDLAPHGVRVNAVNPGVVITDLHTVENAVPDYEGFLERAKSTHPLGRVGQADEVAALVTFLCSEEAGWITGALYAIDGGRAQLSAR